MLVVRGAISVPVLDGLWHCGLQSCKSLEVLLLVVETQRR